MSAADMDARWQALLDFDAAHVWHPYATCPAPQRAFGVRSTEGVRLCLADGAELIDGMSSWWCAVHGYKHPHIEAALKAQLARMAHVMFGGLTHEPAIALAQRLLELAPDGLDRVFFADSGSVAVEVAIKMCVQYQRAIGRPERFRMLALRGAYHGDTLGAMAVCDPVGGMHARFEGVLSKNVFAERPPDGFDEPLAPSWEAHVRTLIAAHAHELAAIIAEPIVQGAGGMRFHSPACLALLRAVCDEHGLLLVADEIATGFGRTGAMFACEHAAVTPDVMCVGKALTGGTMSLAATICTGEVAEEIGRDGPLMHGPTFMGNPLACAAALASLELLADPRRREDVARIEGGLRAGLERAREVQGVRDVRVLGAIGVVELAQAVDVAQATRAAVDRGVWLRPFRELIYAMPAYVMGDEDVATVADAIVAAAQSQSRQGSAEPARAS